MSGRQPPRFKNAPSPSGLFVEGLSQRIRFQPCPSAAALLLLFQFSHVLLEASRHRFIAVRGKQTGQLGRTLSKRHAGRAGELVRYYKPEWFDVSAAKLGLDLLSVRNSFMKAVEKRMMADVPYGVLLSGGLDSSLVASVICRERPAASRASRAPHPHPIGAP